MGYSNTDAATTSKGKVRNNIIRNHKKQKQEEQSTGKYIPREFHR